MLRLAARQIDLLQRELAQSPEALLAVIFDDGQPVPELVQVVCGVAVSADGALIIVNEDPDPGRTDWYGYKRGDPVALFRISDYLGTPLTLISRIRVASAEAEWIVLHAGGTMCPPSLLELMRYVASQRFTKPRFLILVERLDLICAAPELADLAALGQPIDLTANRDQAYFREIITSADLDPETLTLLADVFARLWAGPLPDLTPRSLERTCELAPLLGLRHAVEGEYLDSWHDSGTDMKLVERIIEELLRERTP
jgi:hypothetical protein